MTFDDYRRWHSKILLGTDGSVPEGTLNLEPDERDATLARIACAYDLVMHSGQLLNRQRGVPAAPTGAETWASWKRWMLSHHLFLPFISVITECLSLAAKTWTAGNVRESRDWVRLAARIRRGQGGLFLYGIEFQPCSTIYCRAIRSGMPPAFSGFWIRELRGFNAAVLQFRSTLRSTTTRTEADDLRNEWARADSRYHELHVRSMHISVPDGQSLAAVYKSTNNGKKHEITEAEFAAYDSWFSVQRTEDLSRLYFIFEIADVIERVVADMLAGHRLEPDVTTDLRNGMQAALVVFGRWVGPIDESSSFYPKSLRGE